MSRVGNLVLGGQGRWVVVVGWRARSLMVLWALNRVVECSAVRHHGCLLLTARVMMVLLLMGDRLRNWAQRCLFLGLSVLHVTLCIERRFFNKVNAAGFLPTYE